MGRWASASLLGAIGILALLMLVGAWPRRGKAGEENSRAASAAAASNVAWAVTSKEGAVLDCNAAYRALAGVSDVHPVSPQHAFPAKDRPRTLSLPAPLPKAASAKSIRNKPARSWRRRQPLKHGEAAWFTRLVQAQP
jgi:hypothetical protein